MICIGRIKIRLWRGLELIRAEGKRSGANGDRSSVLGIGKEEDCCSGTEDKYDDSRG